MKFVDLPAKTMRRAFRVASLLVVAQLFTLCISLLHVLSYPNSPVATLLHVTIELLEDRIESRGVSLNFRKT